jgi:glycosyltransferase involved in cell wall biosynthesis
LKVLVIAEAANPEWVSVPAVGWQHYRALSGVVDAHLVTQVRNRPAIEKVGLPPGMVTVIDSEPIARPIWKLAKLLRRDPRKGWTTGVALSVISYLYFERLLWQRFGPAIRSGEYDLVHRITPLSPTLPSPVAARCARAGVPFIVGPLNGGVPWPRAFDAARRKEREWLSYVRAGYRLVPHYRGTRRHAAAIICGSFDTLEQVPGRYRDRCVYIPENGVDPGKFSRRVEGEVGRPLRAAFVGRLVPYKGADMLLEAGAELVRQGRLTIDLIGDGPERERLEGIIERERLQGRVTISGWIEHRAVQERLARADVFAFPSIREFGGAVVLEAMALGLMPIVVDYGGPGELVTPSTGYRVPMGPRESIVRGFRERLGAVAADPGEVRAMGSRGRERVMASFTWEAKALQVVEVYNWVLGLRQERPSVAELFGEEMAMQEAVTA